MFSFIRYDSGLYEGAYKFIYVSGSGEYKHTDTFDTMKDSRQLLDFYTKKEAIVKIVKENIDKSAQEIAKLTQTEMKEPALSREEFESNFNYLGSYFDDYKKHASDLYDQNLKYVIDDVWYFILERDENGNYERIEFLNESDSSFVLIENLSEEAEKSEYTNNNFEKISVNGGFYDKFSRYYSDCERVPYFTSNGKRFYYYSKVNFKAENEEDYKKIYLASEDGEKYDYRQCFVDSSGCLYFDTQNLLSRQSDGKYKSPSGRIYTKAFSTSWDENGNIIDV